MTPRVLIFWLTAISALINCAANGQTLPASLVSAESGQPVSALSVAGLKGDAFTISLRAEVEKFPDDAKGVFDDASPMTLFELGSPGNARRLVLRLHRGRPQVALASGERWRSLNGTSEIEPGEWHHYAVSVGDGQLSLYVDGRLDLLTPWNAGPEVWSVISIGKFGGQRPLLGKWGNLQVFGSALTRAQAESLAGPVAVRTPAQSSRWVTYGKYPALQVVKDGLHPLIDQLHVSATVVPWSAPDAPDLLVRALHSRYFGSRLALFRPVGRDDRGLPIYDTGETVHGLAGSQFQALASHDTTGVFDLFAMGEGTPYGARNLIYWRNTGKPGQPVFSGPELVNVAGKSFEQAVSGAVGGWLVAPLDGDEIPDLLVAVMKSGPADVYWPDGERMWNGVERRNSGSGRGYDVQGRWLGGEVISELFWARGLRSVEGKVEFGALKLVHYRQPGFGVQWKSGEFERAMAVVTLSGRRYLIHTGSVDRILALPFDERNGEIFCGDAQPLLADGLALAGTYFPGSISVSDLNGDGSPELLLDGNPGRLIVLQGNQPGAFREVGSLLMKGGPVAVDTLACPARVDWDGDGFPDLVLGDASGWLTFWPGTADPFFYRPPGSFTVDGEAVHHQAGESGSIQGPNERRWGYLQPTVGDWDGDGSLEIITNDVLGKILLYRRKEGLELARPEAFQLAGRDLPAAWRSRPAIVPASANILKSGRPGLLHLDWEGDLAVAIPDKTGSTAITHVEKLCYEDGQTIRLCGPAGYWGRAELTVADWNEDGKWDVVFGTNGGCNRFFMDDAPAHATPLWLENVGTAAQPVFRCAKPISLKDGGLIDLDVHNASVWPTDLDGNGHLDLIIGAEDGKVYRFLRDQLSW